MHRKPQNTRSAKTIPYNGRMLKTNAQRRLSLPLAFMLAMACAFAFFNGVAYAEGDGPDTSYVEPSDLQKRVEASAIAYNDATARVADLQARIDENNARIAQVEAELPEQQARADAALVSMYKLSGSGSALRQVLTSPQDLGEFLSACDYLTAITSGHMGELNKLQAMREELDEAQAQLQAEMVQADEAKAKAEQALAEAQAARQEAMDALAASISQEEVEAVQQQVVEEAVEQATQQAADQGLDAEAAAAQVEAARVQAQDAAASIDAAAVASGGVDWSMSKDEFVSEWSGRIDTYLDGSPLEGQGQNFAESAWDHGVDPRWSPAIANTESTKGEYCFADYNAWGWGSESWDNWDEAIEDHITGLANGYGGTITQEGAEKYCPPNAEDWYNDTLAQMNQI